MWRLPKRHYVLFSGKHLALELLATLKLLCTRASRLRWQHIALSSFPTLGTDCIALYHTMLDRPIRARARPVTLVGEQSKQVNLKRERDVDVWRAALAVKKAA